MFLITTIYIVQLQPFGRVVQQYIYIYIYIYVCVYVSRFYDSTYVVGYGIHYIVDTLNVLCVLFVH